MTAPYQPIRKMMALTSQRTKLSILFVAQICRPWLVMAVVQNRALWLGHVLEEQLSIRVFLLKLPVLETSGLSAVGFYGSIYFF